MTEIIFNTGNFTLDHQRKITDFLTLKIAQASDINLSTLKSIIITENFTQDIIELQSQYKVNEEIPASNAEVAAVAKVIHAGHGPDLVQSIVIRDYVIAGLFSDDLADSCFHHLHHEMCRVHDNYCQQKMLGQEGRMDAGLNDYENMLISHARAIWSEYAAVRLSASSFPAVSLEDAANGLAFGSPLLQLLEMGKQGMKDAVADYRNHGDILSLFLYCQDVSSVVLKNMAAAQGYIDGLNLNDTAAEHAIANLMAHTDLNDWWIGLTDALRRLFKAYPNWQDIRLLLELGNFVACFWNALGIYPRYVKEMENIYVDVPLLEQ